MQTVERDTAERDTVIYRETAPRTQKRTPMSKRLAVLLPASVVLLLAAVVLGSGFAPAPARPNPDADADASRRNIVSELQRALGTVAPTAAPANDAAQQAQRRPVPSVAAPAALSAQERVATTEAAVRTGQFDADLLYRDGTRVVAVAHFDLGDNTRKPRVYMRTTYHTASGTQVSERVTEANETWQRMANGKWMPVKSQPGAFAQVQALLPHADAAGDAVMTGSPTALRWYDASRDVDVTLNADTSTGVPQKLTQVSRTSGATFTVTYRDWNGNVDGMFPNVNAG